MKSSLAAAALIALGSLSAAADTLAEKPDCAADLAYAVTLLNGQPSWGRIEPRPGVVPVAENGRCVLRNGVFSVKLKGPPYLLLMEEVVWTAVWGEDGRVSMPPKLRLDIPKIKRALSAGERNSEVTKSVEDSESSFWGVHLDYEIDVSRDLISLNRLGLSVSPRNRVLVSGQIQLADRALTQLNGVGNHQDGAFGVNGMEFQVLDEGLIKILSVASFALVQYAFKISVDDSELFVKMFLSDQIEKLPEGLVDQSSRSALLSMVDMLPDLQGIMHFKMNSKNGLFLNDIEALEEGGEEPLVERLLRAGITISARHEPVLP